MTLLKSLIQRLLDSRTTPEEAGHSAMPQEDQVISYGSTTENPGSWTTILSFTAPKDGYAKAVVVGTGKNSAELYCGNMRLSAFAPVDNASINVVMPVRKGASVGLVSTVFRSAALYFVPSIGGGYNRFVRRALPCLKPSFNFLPRSFCKASILTLLTSVGRVRILRRNTSQVMLRKTLWPRSAVGRSLDLMPQLTTLGLGLRTLPEGLATLLTQPAKVSGRPSQCRRATQSVSVLGMTTQTRLPSYLFATNRLNNLLSTGGALC